MAMKNGTEISPAQLDQQWAVNILRQIASQVDSTASLLEKAAAEGDQNAELQVAAASLARHAGLIAETALTKLGEDYRGVDHWMRAEA